MSKLKIFGNGLNLQFHTTIKLHLQLETPASHYVRCTQISPYQWLNKKHQVAVISNGLKSPFSVTNHKTYRVTRLFYTSRDPHNDDPAAKPLRIPCLPSAHLMHKLYSSHSLFIAQEASLCQAQLHPLWCCSTGQTHLVHNYSKLLNFNKSCFSNQSTLLDGNPFS